ncbi:2-oxo-4-hydroxy-4-carboxy-5-ureidoimidazoline decarboxylase [Micromonospora sp. KC606]|uniref:2-oxo-4-hydroxy-4-carboxy-5-ureidoimidazoline decarboxylase n=1 Tax=Micromonospora sp. KC606 TaxID=2530379 RepID=UPI0010433E6F|nr:2-oxo-4-hydroxy-4-carboxy-5-ureidoimidazoline decarboxylase [Micromonospora sp. KC606]TDC85034.1 2-oxo-4-hydroxy-4-carboxy-5-ureidoimidazoline decarboxylase [Micromonospora sp. KC606]
MTIWTLEHLNTAPDDDHLRSALCRCCSARVWVAAIVAGRPYADQDALGVASDAATMSLDPAGFTEALAGHPRIGERVPIHGEQWSRQEQAGVAGADEQLRAELAAANAAYEQRFGHLYLVCATGLPATDLLDICRVRLTNDPVAERTVSLAELAKINRLRLGKLLRSEDR